MVTVLLLRTTALTISTVTVYGDAMYMYMQKSNCCCGKNKSCKVKVYSMNESYGFASSKDLIIIISIVQKSFMVVKSGL